MQRSKSQQPGKGPKAGTLCLVIDSGSTLCGQIVRTVTGPIRLAANTPMAGGLKPGDVVNDLQPPKDGWAVCALSHLLIPIPPPAKAARMFGEKAEVA